jgi:hypothetical protein
VSKEFKMRSLLSLFLVIGAPLAAQAPEGWTWTLDRTATDPRSGDVAPGEWAYQMMPPGWHLTTTTEGVSLFPVARRVMEGAWGVEAEFFLFPNPSDQGTGIALLPTTDTEHKGELRVLLRRDGQVSIEVSHQGETHVIAPWTQDTAAAAHDGKEVKQYVLRVMHQGDNITVAVNGRQMLTLPMGPNVQHPVAGFRAGAGLNLHISRFDLITPLAPPRQH